jgi:hypothetical protein
MEYFTAFQTIIAFIIFISLFVGIVFLHKFAKTKVSLTMLWAASFCIFNLLTTPIAFPFLSDYFGSFEHNKTFALWFFVYDDIVPLIATLIVGISFLYTTIKLQYRKQE